MPTEPYTPAELEAGGDALDAWLIKLGLPANLVQAARPYGAAAAVLDAVLPDHDARIRAEVAEEIATALENESGPREYDWGQYSNAAHIARAHATTEEPT